MLVKKQAPMIVTTLRKQQLNIALGIENKDSDSPGALYDNIVY